jgi:hypothetical protein
MPVPLIAAGVAAIGTIGGAVISSHAQSSAANTAAQAQQQATSQELQLGRENINFQQGIYNQNKALLTPFVDRGNTAGNSINALLGLGGSPAQPANAAAQGYQSASPYTQQSVAAQTGDYRPAFNGVGQDATGVGGFALKPMHNDIMAMLNEVARERLQQTGQLPAQQTNPATTQTATAAAPAAGQTAGQASQDAFNTFAHSAGMDFQLKQGENAINNGYAARGQIQSGAAMKALQNYGQNTALNNYFLPYMGLLQGQQATGAQSGAAIAGVGSNFGNTVSNIYGQQGNAIQNGADATSNAALLRGQANANMWNSIGGALAGFASSFFPTGGGGGGGSPSYGRYY